MHRIGNCKPLAPLCDSAGRYWETVGTTIIFVLSSQWHYVLVVQAADLAPALQANIVPCVKFSVCSSQTSNSQVDFDLTSSLDMRLSCLQHKINANIWPQFIHVSLHWHSAWRTYSIHIINSCLPGTETGQ